MALLIAIDNSGSTHNPHYWKSVEPIFQKYATEPNVKCIFWNSYANEEPMFSMRQIIARGGNSTGGTLPQTIVPYLRKYQAASLALITDGEISQNDVDALDRDLPTLPWL